MIDNGLDRVVSTTWRYVTAACRLFGSALDRVVSDMVRGLYAGVERLLNG